MEPTTQNRWLAFVYAATIFTSAFLLFQIQPMVSKAILPWFGGTPAVWTICLLFFQTLLFAGYAYAHFSNNWLSPRQQALLHIVMIAGAFLLLRVLPDASWQPHGEAEPTRQILLMLVMTIGLPYFVLSATGPLLQAWFARSFPTRTPYRLYALSNVGSLLALISYPFLSNASSTSLGKPACGKSASSPSASSAPTPPGAPELLQHQAREPGRPRPRQQIMNQKQLGARLQLDPSHPTISQLLPIPNSPTPSPQSPAPAHSPTSSGSSSPPSPPPR